MNNPLVLSALADTEVQKFSSVSSIKLTLKLNVVFYTGNKHANFIYFNKLIVT